jgi:hypothetical protein
MHANFINFGASGEWWYNNQLHKGGNGVVCLNLGAFQNVTLLQNS